MATVKELMKQIEDGFITVDEATREMSTKSFPRVDKSEQVDVSEVKVYDDDSLFWVGLASTKGIISSDEYNRLVESAG